MTACDKCWDQAWVEARYGTGETQIEAYYRILEENEDKPHHRSSLPIEGEGEKDG